MKVPYFLFIAFALISCDIDFGENGVIVDNQTGARLEGVSVKMVNSLKSASDTSKANGYFAVLRSTSCGFNCDSRYTITFTKPGYDTLVINENYHKVAEFIDGRYDDTLVVKLLPLP